MEGFEYELAIKDSMSGPEHAVQGALEGVEHAALKADHAVAHLGQTHESTGKHAKEHEGFLDEFTKSLVPQIALGELAAEGLKKLGEGFLELGEKIVDFAAEGVEFALEAAEFRENMVLAFNVVSQTADEGEKTYDAIEKMAVANHQGIQKALGLARELSLAGIENEQRVSNVVQATGELQRVGLEGAAEKLRRVVEQSESLGHFALPKKLGAGFNLDSLVADLSKTLGKTPAIIRQELKAGKIAADVGIDALTRSITNGKVGELAAKKFDLKDVVTDWHNAWQQLVESVDAGPLTSALRNFVGIFSDGTNSSAALKDELVSDVNAIIKWLGAGIDAATTFGLRLELGFLQGKLAAKPLLDEMARVGIITPSISELGQEIQVIAKWLTVAGVAGAFLVTEIQAIQGWLGKQGAGALHAGGHESAGGFVEGIAAGLLDGRGVVGAAATDLGNAAIAKLRAVWQSHSPSMVAFDIGQGVGEGMALGATSSSDKAANAVGAALSPPDFSGHSGMGGGHRNVTIAAGAVHVEVHGAAANAEEIGAIVEEKLADVIERVNLELGG